MRLVLIAMALTGCVNTAALTHSASALTAPSCNVRDNGAVGDGIADDRAAIQATLDACAGQSVAIPAGYYLLTAAPGHSYALRVAAGTAVRGSGQATTTILLAAAPLSTQILWIEDAPDVTLQGFTLDGQHTLQGPPSAAGPQRHGAIIKHSPRIVIASVTSQHNAGDGFYLYAGSDHATIVDSAAIDNDRDGVTLGGATDGVTASGSTFSRNAQDGWHSEGGGNNNDVALTGNALAGNAVFAITMSGVTADPTGHNYRWSVTDNSVDGPVAIVYADDVVYARNHGTNAGGLPSVSVYRQCERIRVEDNALTATGIAVGDSVAVISVEGTDVGQSPGSVVVARNTISTAHPQYGVAVISARDVEIVGNVIAGSPEGTGPHGVGLAGVFVRATRVGVMPSVAVRGNTVAGFGRWSVMLGGSGAAKIAKVVIEGNAFGQPASLDDGLHEAIDVTASGLVVAQAPTGVLVALDGQRWVQ